MTLTLWDNTARVFIFTDNFVFLFVVAVFVVNYKHAIMHVSEFQKTLDIYSAVEPKSPIPSAGSPFSPRNDNLALG
jgi:hypothetical protein